MSPPYSRNEAHARALAEKNRMDPPPAGKVWSLGYDGAGRRAPEFDVLVTEERELEADPIDFGRDEHGVREELVSAVLDEWASRNAHLEGEDAVGLTLDMWAPRDLAQMAADAVTRHVARANGVELPSA